MCMFAVFAVKLRVHSLIVFLSTNDGACGVFPREGNQTIVNVYVNVQRRIANRDVITLNSVWG